ncbi:hypothetical protein V5O48_012800 [Marasmius crinis-equi]|uniref:Uncharacterized protein n=1 Tax=Marasmius crinis-equi TaxID=585013 RepID=A0ABR3F1U2_9AGAR
MVRASLEEEGLAKAYQNHIDAQRDFRMYSDSGMIEVLNRPVIEGEGYVVAQGYRVGIYGDVLSALIIGLRWEVGDIVWCCSRERAVAVYKQKLMAGEVRTKIEKVETVRGRMFPVHTYSWIVKTQ